MTEMGLAQPLVDPISVLVGAFSGGTGAVSISGLARSYASIPGELLLPNCRMIFEDLYRVIQHPGQYREISIKLCCKEPEEPVDN